MTYLKAPQTIDNSKTRPFLKWAGGKYRLIDKIKQSLPQGARLIEPFAGSGSVFLNTSYDAYVLADINQDLIACFSYLQEEKQLFIESCREFFQDKHNNKAAFHALRTEFNTTTDKRLKAVLFVYLNRHCFNGLMRYNSSGYFNTSFGQYLKPYFPEKEMLVFAKKASSARIICTSYIEAMALAVKGDVIYCDPPYVPLSLTASFTKYHATGFGQEDQEKLVEMANDLSQQGIPILISNHDTEFVRHMYQSAKISRFDVQRNISCQGKLRNKAPELLALFGRE